MYTFLFYQKNKILFKNKIKQLSNQSFDHRIHLVLKEKHLVLMKMNNNISDSFCEDLWEKQCDVMIAFGLFSLSLYI